VTRIYGNPFTQSPGGYGLDGGKPALIGECPAKGTAGRSSMQNYEDAYLNGWQGVLAWASNGSTETVAWKSLDRPPGHFGTTTHRCSAEQL
jgi:hypothetical protein